MKPLALFSAAAVVAAAAFAPLAHADSFALGLRDRNVAIGVQLGDPVVAYAPRPYCPPRYYAPPVAVYPSGYWVQPRYYGERRYGWGPDRYYERDGWRHRRWHDDDRRYDEGRWHRRDR